MEYKEKLEIPAQTKEVAHYISSCLKCGCDDIDVDFYPDKWGDISTLTCKNKQCENKLRLVRCSIKNAIAEWNRQNDIPTLIANKKEQIPLIRKEIRELGILLKSRKNKK